MTVDGEVVGAIGSGLLLLLGVSRSDTVDTARSMIDKVLGLRIFDDADGKMNLSLLDTGGELLIVSQFTLYGDTSRGRRPSYIDAARPEEAERLYDSFVDLAKERLGRVSTGRFRAMMDVTLINDGPVTLIVET